MKTSLITTTYNWPEALDLVLKSLSRQTVKPDEVIIADDGSRSETADLVQQWQSRLPIPLLHVWQEDKGFRLARSRNQAIAAASGDYLILVDGDMVLHHRFIADHKAAARPGYFIQGTRVNTSPTLGKRMLREGMMDPGLFCNGLKPRKYLVRSWLLSRLILLLSKPRRVRRIMGCHQAYWKNDLLRVNGFNEQIVGWGAEDDEIAARLVNAGVKRTNLQFHAHAIHLFHPRREPMGENPNYRILNETIKNRLNWCKEGLAQHVSAFSQGIPEIARPPA